MIDVTINEPKTDIKPASKKTVDTTPLITFPNSTEIEIADKKDRIGREINHRMITDLLNLPNWDQATIDQLNALYQAKLEELRAENLSDVADNFTERWIGCVAEAMTIRAITRQIGKKVERDTEMDSNGIDFAPPAYHNSKNKYSLYVYFQVKGSRGVQAFGIGVYPTTDATLASTDEGISLSRFVNQHQLNRMQEGGNIFQYALRRTRSKFNQFSEFLKSKGVNLSPNHQVYTDIYLAGVGFRAEDGQIDWQSPMLAVDQPDSPLNQKLKSNLVKIFEAHDLPILQAAS